MHVRSHGGRPGVFVGRPGTMMGGTANVSITVRGAGGHGAFPHLARDPITVAAEIVLALQTQVTRRYDVFDPVVVTVGAMRAGTAANVIPAQAHLDATVRTFSTATQERVAAEITGLCEGIAAAHGLTVEVGYDPGYPVTVNDPAGYDFAAATVADVLGADRFEQLEHPVAAAEDFSHVLNAVPGCYLVLNAAGADDPLTAAVNHSPQAVFDDSVLTDGALIHTELAIRALCDHVDPGARPEDLHATR
jgi:amidohydrolase